MKHFSLRTVVFVLAVLLFAAGLPTMLYARAESPVASFTLNTVAGEEVVFSPEDFTSRLSSEAELDGIVITSLPDASSGQLLYGGRTLLEGEAIAVESLGALRFEPANTAASAAVFQFLPVYAEGVSLDSVTVAIQQSSVHNSPPAAVDIQGKTYRNVSVELQLQGNDPEGDTLTFSLTGKPARGEATLDAETGILTYTPYHDKSGEDTFTYTVTDSAGNTSEPAEITIEISRSDAAHTYADMEGNGAEYAALRLSEQGLMTGEQIGGTYFFHPDELITRGEFLTLTVQALSQQEVTPVLMTGFSDDADTPAWVRPYASAALKAGIIHGSASSSGELLLLSEQPLTMAEAAVMLDNALSLEQADVSATVFASDTTVWAVQPAANLQQAGLLPVGGGSLSQTVTRAEAAKLLCTAMDQQQETSSEGKWFFGLF